MNVCSAVFIQGTYHELHLILVKEEHRGLCLLEVHWANDFKGTPFKGNSYHKLSGVP